MTFDMEKPEKSTEREGFLPPEGALLKWDAWVRVRVNEGLTLSPGAQNFSRL